MREAGPKQTKPSAGKDSISTRTSPFLPSPILALQNCSSCPPPGSALRLRPDFLLPQVCRLHPPRSLTRCQGLSQASGPAVGTGGRAWDPGAAALRAARRARSQAPSPCHLGLGSSVPSSPPHSPGPLPPALPANLGSAFRDDRHAPARGPSGRPSAPPGSPLPPASLPPSPAPAPQDARHPRQPHWPEFPLPIGCHLGNREQRRFLLAQSGLGAIFVRGEVSTIRKRNGADPGFHRGNPD